MSYGPYDDPPSISAGLVRLLVGAIVTGFGIYQLAVDRKLPTRAFGGNDLALAVSVGMIVLGLVLVFGLATRFAALLLLAGFGFVFWRAGLRDGGIYLAAPPFLMLLCLVLLGTGGGRWALLDRFDPARQRILDKV